MHRYHLHIEEVAPNSSTGYEYTLLRPPKQAKQPLGTALAHVGNFNLTPDSGVHQSTTGFIDDLQIKITRLSQMEKKYPVHEPSHISGFTDCIIDVSAFRYRKSSIILQDFDGDHHNSCYSKS
jgi:hypothetical protein